MWFEKYKLAKENSKNRRLEEYKKNILRLANDIEEALKRNQVYLFDDSISKSNTDIARKMLFSVEIHPWGNYINFNKLGLWRLQRKLKKYNLVEKVDE